MKALPVLDTRAAGIDVGSEKLHVSIAGDTPKVFGTFTGDLERLRDWFREQGVHSVALEATGVYWLYVYEVLEAAGLEVVVVNGRHVQNVPGRKTDMADCQWLATLHAHGLLRGGFVPPADIRQLQDYQRLRADHLIGAASQVQKMQQALERMNIKFHDVISDLVGVSGLKVVRAILQGERRPGELLALCDVQIQKQKADRVKESLRGCWKKEQLFALRQGLELWETYQQKIADCDRELAGLLHEMTGPQPPEGGRGNAVGPVALAPARSPGKNAPVIERLQELVARLCGGRDVTQIPGMSVYLVLQLISEVGTDMARWPKRKALRLVAGTGRWAQTKRQTQRPGQSPPQPRRADVLCGGTGAGPKCGQGAGRILPALAGPVGRVGRQCGAGSETGAPVLPPAALRHGLRRERSQKL